MVEPTQPTQEDGEEAPAQIEEQSLASQEAVVSVFQRLTEENPEGAILAMRENLASAVEEEKITPEFQRILSEILDDVASVTPEQQAQTFQQAVENSPELRDEMANVLLLQDSAMDQMSSFLESGNPMAILFAVLSIVAGGGNTDFMSAMTDIMEDFGVDPAEIEDMREHIADNDTEVTAAPSAVTPESDAPVSEPVVAQAEVEGDVQAEQVVLVENTELRGLDFSGADSEFQGDEAIRVDALAALDNAGVPAAGISGLEQGGMPTEQLEETATINLAVPS